MATVESVLPQDQPIVGVTRNFILQLHFATSHLRPTASQKEPKQHQQLLLERAEALSFVCPASLNFPIHQSFRYLVFLESRSEQLNAVIQLKC